MTYRSSLITEKLYDAYAEIHNSLDGARLSIDELQIEITDELSALTTALSDIREELDRSTHMMRRLSNRMDPVLTSFMEQEEHNIPFLTDD